MTKSRTHQGDDGADKGVADDPAAQHWGQATRSVHQALPSPPAQRPLATPVYRSAAWEFDTAESYADLLAGREAGYSYSRIDNPTVDAFAASVAALEGADAGQGFGSGMGAISTVLTTLL